MIFGIPGPDEKTTAAALGVSPFFVKDYLIAAKNYGFAGTENALLLLHQYNLRYWCGCREQGGRGADEGTYSQASVRV
jgi:DNA polymerase-3 subunit delta